MVVCTTLICFVAAEAVVRIRYGDKFGPRPGFYVAERRLGWKPAPNLDDVYYGPDYEIAIRTDADGYRLGVLGAVDYSKELVILCGDSYTFGWGVSTDQTFASNIDRLLHEQSKGRVRAVNLGVGGYGTFQSCVRLEDFFRIHEDAKPRLVVLQHSVNDATDNIRNIGYYFGYWKTETVADERSRVHLVNLIRYLRAARKNADAGPAPKASEPYLQDLLWGFRRTEELGYPDKLTFGARTLRFSPDMLRSEFSTESLAQRKKLSDAQRVLMLEALNCLHRVALAHDATVVHMFIATTPDWYIRDVTDIVRASADSTHCAVAITGAIPQPKEFAGSITNTHSGGHFNGDFNRFWAETLVDWLSENHLLATDNHSPQSVNEP